MLSPMKGYAATALECMALRDAGHARGREIVEMLEIPAAYLSKIVHQLGRMAFVATRRGTSGGVRLAIDPAKTTLYQLCEALGDSIREPRCLLDTGQSYDDVTCPVHSFSRRLRDSPLEFLRETTPLAVGRFDQRERSASKTRKSRA